MNVSLSKKVWEMFVREGVLDSSRLSKRISESWYLCKQAGVNPHEGEGRQILEAETLSKRKQENARLLDVAGPYMDKLYQSIRNSGSILLLIDADGYVLVIKGDKPTLRLAEKINFIQGVKWTEQEVGTNAIGTALRTGEAISVVGSEHYALASQSWTCAAAPIRDQEGQLLGLLDVSSPVSHNHPHTLAAVTSMAYAIEHQWHIMEKNHELELLKHAYPLLTTHQHLVICNPGNQVLLMNDPVKKKISDHAPIRLLNVLESGYQVKHKKALYDVRNKVLLGYAVFLELESSPAQISFSNSFHFDGEKGTSPIFRDLLRKASQVASFNTDVYIYGETGTGKEVLARAIHRNSPRQEHPFIAINCGAIPRELLESELFGYAEGAFTGARKNGYQGKFQQAQRGTLFLDEVSELTLPMQVALLRVLQEREVTPVGGTQTIRLDVRVISATNQDLSWRVQQGKFREDLFYRLQGFPLEIPPLRERKEDIPSLVHYYCKQHGWSIHLPADVFQALMEHDWFGNVRELFHVLEYMRIVSQEQTPQLHHLPSLTSTQHFATQGYDPSKYKQEYKSLESTLTFREQLEKEKMMEALRQTEGQVSQAASLLQIPRSTFYRKLKKYRL